MNLAVNASISSEVSPAIDKAARRLGKSSSAPRTTSGAEEWKAARMLANTTTVAVLFFLPFSRNSRTAKDGKSTPLARHGADLHTARSGSKDAGSLGPHGLRTQLAANI